MALFAFSSFLNTLCSKATELKDVKSYVKTDVYVFNKIRFGTIIQQRTTEKVFVNKTAVL